ncbi:MULTISPECIES: cyclopropane-fatty-acyl-phospholipid synthase family protein [unclassified Anabaena]|uniref:SAM-dependent methyltransferase n=1 Tax=unclassified Anabaena TaxID=2619674 RepID=UPI0008321330|nr:MULTISPECIES: class I SAM-dependent methyltransferase [unclassified Anabaena]
MDNQTEYIAALINLHRGLNRQGPGDADFSRHILNNLPTLPAKPRIVDLGCGSGAGALLLAQYYQSKVIAVDTAAIFIEELTVRAQQAGLEHLITPIHADMGKLDWPDASVDLLWSEGAAYNLGFEYALKLWRSLLANDGIAVVSEMSWFSDQVPEPAIAYWQTAYPMIGSEQENIRRATTAGLSVLSTHRLPSSAWWINYYEPLREKIKQIEITPVTQAVIHEIEEEIALFEKFSDFYGYTFYIMRPTPDTVTTSNLIGSS